MTDRLAVPAPDAAPLQEPWAGWHLRVGAYLVDAALGLPFVVVSAMLLTVAQDPTSNPVTQPLCALLSLANSLAGLVFSIWNSIVRQGRRGASLGKQCFGILVISMHDARPIGAGPTFVRQLAHVLDALSIVGYLWPLWDEKKQTFADKIVHTAVLRLPGVRF